MAGWQAEQPEVAALQPLGSPPLYGRSRSGTHRACNDEQGRYQVRILTDSGGTPYDTPVPGQSRTRGVQLSGIRRGHSPVVDKPLQNISKVLYPNDNTLQDGTCLQQFLLLVPP